MSCTGVLINGARAITDGKSAIQTESPLILCINSFVYTLTLYLSCCIVPFTSAYNGEYGAAALDTAGAVAGLL